MTTASESTVDRVASGLTAFDAIVLSEICREFNDYNSEGEIWARWAWRSMGCEGNPSGYFSSRFHTSMKKMVGLGLVDAVRRDGESVMYNHESGPHWFVSRVYSGAKSLVYAIGHDVVDME